jgi:hypothetical protein
MILVGHVPLTRRLYKARFGSEFRNTLTLLPPNLLGKFAAASGRRLGGDHDNVGSDRFANEGRPEQWANRRTPRRFFGAMAGRAGP